MVSNKATLPSSSINEIKLIIKEIGTIDGFALWFDLHLENSTDANCTVSTAPGRNTCAWDQGIIFGNKIVNNVSMDGTYPLMIKGQEVTFECSYTDDQINLKVLNSASSDNPLLPGIPACSKVFLSFLCLYCIDIIEL
jgi:hypothetical protein